MTHYEWPTDEEWPTTLYQTHLGENKLGEITVGGTTFTNTQIVIALVGAAIGFYAGKKYLKQSPYVGAIVGALIAYFIGKSINNNAV